LLSLLFFTDDVKQLKKKNKKLLKNCSIQTTASYLSDLSVVVADQLVVVEHLSLKSTKNNPPNSSSNSSLIICNCDENLLINDNTHISNKTNGLTATSCSSLDISRDHSSTPSTNENSSNNFTKKTKVIRGKKRRRRGRRH
jgi:hypothetical protein